MNQEILFRGKMKGSKTRHEELNWAFGDLVRELETGRCFIVDLAHFDENTKLNDVIIEVAPETVCQYTGLTDKNGRKIFEWDIIRKKVNVYKLGNLAPCGERMLIGSVIWDDSSSIYPGGWSVKTKDENGNDAICVFDRNFEVIGNIFDNPELLEGGAE